MRKILTVLFLAMLASYESALLGQQSSVHAGGAGPGLRPTLLDNLQQGGGEQDVIDVRKYGVDCSFTRDSSAALNALTAAPENNGHPIVFPPKCHVRVANTWSIKNLSAFTVRGLSGAGANGFYGTNVPTLSWAGPAGGAMIDMEYVDGFVIENLAIDGAGSAGVGINVDKAGSGGTVNTTDGILRRININSNFAGGGRAGWIGLRFANVSTNNVEDMRVLDSTIRCQKTPNSTAILVGASANAKNFQILHNDISDCTFGIVTSYGGSFDISFNEFGTNGTDITLGLVSDPTRISYNLSESEYAGERFLNATQLFTNDGIEVSGNHIPVNDVCAVNINNARVSAAADNTFYPGYQGTGAKLCNSDGKGNSATVVGLGGLGPAALATFLQQSVPNGSHNRIVGNSPTGWISNTPEFVAQSTGGLLLKRAVFYSRNDNVDGFTNSNQLQNGLPCGLDTTCEDEGSKEVTGVASPEGLTCQVAGTDTSAAHVYLISAVDADGLETLLRGNGNAANCRGPQTFDEKHYETLDWLASPNAVSYNLYAANPSDQIRVSQIATGIKSTSYVVKSYPRTFTVVGQRNALNRTLSHVFRGKAVELQYGTPLKGFRDRGITEVFSLSSDGLQLGSSGTLISQMKVYSTGPITPLEVPPASCSDQTFAVKGLTTADHISNLVPPATLGNVSLNGYVSAPDTLLLHFCNPSSSPVPPPRGAYSILAVH